MFANGMGACAGTLDWQVHSGYRNAALTVPSRGKAGFTEMGPSASGIRFTNVLAEERSLTNQIFLNGSGIAAGDVDGDGLCDLYFCGLDSPNALYRNLGSWRFENITAQAGGVGCKDQASTGAALADVDGDGDLDLLVNGMGRGTRLFINDSHGKFQEVTDEAGLRGKSGATSMTLADVDGDGLLDLYAVNYRSDTMRDMPDIQFSFGVTNGAYTLLSVNGRRASHPDVAGRFSFTQGSGVLENGEADTLFRNLGNHRFIPVSWTNGAFLDENGQTASVPYDWGLSAMFRDLNGDGAPDLYVCNDFQSPDRLWMNDGKGRFRAAAASVLRQTSLFSMGVDFADVDRDGLDDFFVADMRSREHERRQVQVMDATAFAQFRNPAGDRPQFSRNALFHNRGDGTYAEWAQLSGLEASDWSWCPIFLDVDLDGYEDLLVTTGHWRDAQHADISAEIDRAKLQKSLSALEQLRLRLRFPRLETPNMAFRNRGNLTFEETGAAWGFGARQVSQGMALADLDNDGDLDVIINCLNSAPLLLRNDSSAPRLAVRLKGDGPNTRGVGANLRVLALGLPLQSQEIICGGRYLSSDDFIRTFAAGSPSNTLTVEVVWRSGRHSVISNVVPNQLIEIDESVGGLAKSDSTRSNALPFFEDLSRLLDHRHTDEPFDDFSRQPLLPHKLSQLGPGVTWFDFNGDGWDDLFIGAGRGGRLGVFRNDGRGGFVRQRAKPFEAPVERDLTAVLAWQPNPTNAVLLLGEASYEEGSTNAAAFQEFSIVDGTFARDLLRSPFSTGPLALADIDGDGDLDLFVGGRVRAGRYPEAASSWLLRNDGARLQLDAETSQLFAQVGLASSAMFTDLDGDGWPELLVACEWGPVRIFKNIQGKLAPWNPAVRRPGSSPSAPEALTINQLTGWWNSLAVGDFDGDGKLDFVAGNWGRNTSRHPTLAEPIHLYFGETVPGGDLALLEARRDPELRKLVPTHDWAALKAVFPSLSEHYSTFADFSRAGIVDILAAGLPPMRTVSAVTLDSMLFLNRGNSFEVHALPLEAQASPVFGIAAGDLDGDGTEDLFLAQNIFAVSPFESRHDAGCGLWLRGDGHGQFIPVPAKESGFAVYGEGRGVALSDYDHDGRLDIVIGQNGGSTKLYRNVGAHAGIRVHLDGPASNPKAIGTRMRLVFPDGNLGSVKEIRLGGGCWSQDSSEVIFGFKVPPDAVEISWPGGFTERVTIPSGTLFLTRSRTAR